MIQLKTIMLLATHAFTLMQPPERRVFLETLHGGRTTFSPCARAEFGSISGAMERL
jgi:hypothetical protein